MIQSTALAITPSSMSTEAGDLRGETQKGEGADAQPAVSVTRLLDPTGLGMLPTVPLLPEAILRKHHAFISTDTRFRAAARLMQALWREDRDLPIGTLRDTATGRRRKLGSRINAAAGRAGANFVSPGVARLVERELIFREHGAVIEEDRLRHNLLSSQPLCFNLFGPLKLELDLATAVFAELLPGFIAEVEDIRFEHSPGRGHPAFSADGTAFDVLVRGRTAAGKRALVAAEVKFTEGCHEPMPRFTGQKRFDEIAASSDLFVDHADPTLRQNPTQQLFRQACLATAMLQHELYDVGVHLLVAPRDNHLATNAAGIYRQQLRDPDGGRLPFVALMLERFIEAIATVGAHQLARDLHRRYTDFHLVEGELELELAEASAGIWSVPTSEAPTIDESVTSGSAKPA